MPTVPGQQVQGLRAHHRVQLESQTVEQLLKHRAHGEYRGTGIHRAGQGLDLPHLAPGVIAALHQNHIATGREQPEAGGQSRDTRPDHHHRSLCHEISPAPDSVSSRLALYQCLD